MLLENRRLAYFIPNTFTALNMACGFIAIIFAFHGEFYKACMFIVLGAIFDSVDGRIARMTNTQSSFGEQFDSLSDLVSFGVSPAIVYYFRFLADAGRPGMVACFFFMLCGALRLARFNATIDKNKSEYFHLGACYNPVRDVWRKCLWRGRKEEETKNLGQCQWHCCLGKLLGAQDTERQKLYRKRAV